MRLRLNFQGLFACVGGARGPCPPVGTPLPNVTVFLSPQSRPLLVKFSGPRGGLAHQAISQCQSLNHRLLHVLNLDSRPRVMSSIIDRGGYGQRRGKVVGRIDLRSWRGVSVRIRRVQRPSSIFRGLDRRNKIMVSGFSLQKDYQASGQHLSSARDHTRISL